MTPARSSLNKPATSRRALIKLIALSAGALACNLPTQQTTATPASPNPPTTGSTITNVPEATQAATVALPTIQTTATFTQRFVIDAHADIAWNWLEFRRDPNASALATRTSDPYADFVGQRMTGLAEWQAGHVGIMFASLFVMPTDRAWRSSMTQTYASPEQAHDRALEQLSSYQSLEESGSFRIIYTRADLDSVVGAWAHPSETPPTIGLLISMEGADAIIQPSDVAGWHERGLRAIGPAWAKTRYAGGTGEPGPLTELGGALLDAMSPLNMILDLSHIAEDAYYQAVERYDGVIIASHSNPRAYLPTDRGLSDDMILRLAAKDGVMGIVLYNRYLQPGWQEGDARVPLQTVIEAIDYVAQLTGRIDHVAIGSDMDGGFGLAESPAGIDSAADLLKIADALSNFGYSDEQITAVLYGNWLRMLHRALP